jgi:NTE family protein
MTDNSDATRQRETHSSMSKFITENPKKQDLLRTILRNHFATDDVEVLALIQSEAEYIDLPSGGVLFPQGELSDDVYFVLSGRLRALAENELGGNTVVGEIGRGETIGELPLFTGEPRSASIVAVRACSVVKISRAVIEHVLSKSPQIALSMTRIVIARFRRSERERQTPIVPVNVCMLPITSGIDAVSFANSLRSAQGENKASVAVITPDDIARRFDTDATGPACQWFDAVASFIDEIEAQSSAIYLVADESETAWTRFCLQNSDEILLLADADRAPGISDVEARCFAGEMPISIARQTLVLLHKADLRSPTGTARWLNGRQVGRHFHIRPELPRDMRRLARIVSGRAIGIVLAGGGARGFAHIGVITALEESGIDIDFISGTSIGAIMGATLALDLEAAKIATAVHKAFLLHPKGNITGDYNFIPLVSLIKGQRTHSALVQAFRDATGTDVDIGMEDTWKTLFVIASNFSTGNEAVLSKGSLVRNVIASYAIPGALPPVFIDGNMMFDGGAFNNFPIDVMAQIGAGKIIGVDLSTDRGRTFEIDRVPGTFALLRDKLRPRAKQRYRLPSVAETLFTASFISSVSKQRGMRKFADLLFQPSIPGGGMLDWRRYHEIVAAGYNHAKEVLAGLTDEELKTLH